MKRFQLCLLLLIVALAIADKASAQTPVETCSTGSADPVVVRISGGEPTTLDPALADDGVSTSIITQLFGGLTRLDDATGQVLPDLAASWQASADSAVYTFTLRSGLTWSDGTPLTTSDARYAILRALAPATQASYAADFLFAIQNAQEYHNGTITDPNLVGVSALDATHLRFTLAHSSSSFPSVLTSSVACPVPQAAITAWGSAWTDPSHIVVSGPYRLTEWVHGERMTLSKNPAFFKSSDTQIDEVQIRFLDATAAWPLYLQGLLDTTNIPAGAAVRRSDPVLGVQFCASMPSGTYYYGYNLGLAPFDSVLVRKAFTAAIDRQGLVDSMFGGGVQPALTFTPLGVFGHVDGAAEGVGIPYDPAQARAWLATAGYPNGAGLPPITLWYSEDHAHQAIAEYIRANWQSNLGVTVTLQSMPWDDYSGSVYSGQFQVWRMGWNIDYPDAYNFLADAIRAEGNAFGGWNNTQYWSLVNQANRASDPATRQDLYKQAEQILVGTDVVMAPLYYNVSAIMTRPYLERTYAVVGYAHINDWRINRQSAATATPLSTTVFTPTVDPATTLGFAAGFFPSPTAVTYTALSLADMPPTGDLKSIGHNFEVTAASNSRAQRASVAASDTYTISVRYSDVERRGVIDPKTLALYYWDDNRWAMESTSSVDLIAHSVTARPGHFSTWAVLGRTNELYLPAIVR